MRSRAPIRTHMILKLILVDTGLKELYLPLIVTGIHCTKWWVWKHICQYQWSWDKPYSPGCNHLCPMLRFGSKHVCIGDVHIFKHCREMTLFLLWIGAYCISCVVQQTSWSKGFVFSGKIWWQFFSCNKACSKYRTRSTATPKYTLTQRLVLYKSMFFLKVLLTFSWEA